MSSTNFESLEEDIETLLDKVSKKIEIGISDHECDEERKRIVAKMDQSILESRSILNKMDIEARQAHLRYQQKMKLKINKYENEIQRYRKNIDQLRYAGLSLQQSIMPKPYGNSTNFESEQRKLILMGTASLEQTSESLARSHAITIETEQMGTEVLGELGVQRETLERTRDRLMETQEGVSRSKRIIQGIASNLCNRIMLITVIFLEVLILAGLCYWKFFT